MNDFYFIETYLKDDNFIIPYSKLDIFFDNLWQKSPEKSIDILFEIRNCHGGQGNRYKFYKGIKWFMKNHPNILYKKIKEIPKNGYWKDLLNIWSCGNELLRSFIVIIYCNQLNKDNLALQNGNKISLASKWSPTEKCFYDKKYGLVKIFCEQLKISPKQYRQMISKLRNELEVTERLICDNRWGEIDFDKINYKCRQQFHSKLKKKCRKRYDRWCKLHKID